jgi:hypothetical protein
MSFSVPDVCDRVHAFVGVLAHVRVCVLYVSVFVSVSASPCPKRCIFEKSEILAFSRFFFSRNSKTFFFYIFLPTLRIDLCKAANL